MASLQAISTSGDSIQSQAITIVQGGALGLSRQASHPMWILTKPEIEEEIICGNPRTPVATHPTSQVIAKETLSKKVATIYTKAGGGALTEIFVILTDTGTLPSAHLELLVTIPIE